MKLRMGPLAAFALLSGLCSAGLVTQPARAELSMDVLGDKVMAEEMALQGDTYVSLGSFSTNTLPFVPSRIYPSHITLQAVIHVRNPTDKTINLTKVGFDVYSYDPWTRHTHYVTTVIRHIPPAAQKYLHIPPHEERHSPPNAPSLRFHVPYSSLFHPSSLYALPFEPMAATLNLSSDDDVNALSVMDFVSAASTERSLAFSLGNLDVQGTPVPGPLALAFPCVAFRQAKQLRRRVAMRIS